MQHSLFAQLGHDAPGRLLSVLPLADDIRTEDLVIIYITNRHPGCTAGVDDGEAVMALGWTEFARMLRPFLFKMLDRDYLTYIDICVKSIVIVKTILKHSRVLLEWSEADEAAWGASITTSSCTLQFVLSISIVVSN